MSKKEPKEQVIEMLLVSREGARDLKAMCEAMGHTIDIGKAKTGDNRLMIPFVEWSSVTGMDMVLIVLQPGIEVLLHKDAVRGQFTLKLPSE
jgi:hypothetical protein